MLRATANILCQRIHSPQMRVSSSRLMNDSSLCYSKYKSKRCGGVEIYDTSNKRGVVWQIWRCLTKPCNVRLIPRADNFRCMRLWQVSCAVEIVCEALSADLVFVQRLAHDNHDWETSSTDGCDCHDMISCSKSDIHPGASRSRGRWSLFASS